MTFDFVNCTHNMERKKREKEKQHAAINKDGEKRELT